MEPSVKMAANVFLSLRLKCPVPKSHCLTFIQTRRMPSVLQQSEGQMANFQSFISALNLIPFQIKCMVDSGEVEGMVHFYDHVIPRAARMMRGKKASTRWAGQWEGLPIWQVPMLVSPTLPC